MNHRIEEFPTTRLACVRGVGPYHEVLPISWKKLAAVAGPAGLFSRPGAMCISIGHDNPQSTPADQLRSDAGVSVTMSAVIPDGLTEYVIRSGRYAIFTYVGPYDGLKQAWSDVCGVHVPALNLKFRQGENFEVYVNDPGSTPPEKLQTDIYIPIE